MSANSLSKGIRLALYLAKCGIASRRQAEKIIQDGRVTVDNNVIETPIFFVEDQHTVFVDGKLIAPPPQERMWLYHKPEGLVTTHYDPQGRPTVFDALKEQLGNEHVVSVGRLDLNSEGLLLITNSGQLARQFERPSKEYQRTYHVQVRGCIKPLISYFKNKNDITINGVHYSVHEVIHVCKKNCHVSENHWVSFKIFEGKNREIRRICAHFDLTVKRLIRIAFGPFELSDLKKGSLKEVFHFSENAHLDFKV